MKNEGLISTSGQRGKALSDSRHTDTKWRTCNHPPTMKTIAISALLLIPTLSHADSKASVTLDGSGYSSSGGSGRPKLPEVEISKGFGSKKHEIPVAEQIAALREHIDYLTLMEKHGVDPGKQVTAIYKDVPLADVLRELMPKVPVKFDGVDEKVTIKSMVCNDALMFSVLSWLDDAAGVYFDFSENGIRVTSGPPVAP